MRASRCEKLIDADNLPELYLAQASRGEPEFGEWAESGEAGLDKKAQSLYKVDNDPVNRGGMMASDPVCGMEVIEESAAGDAVQSLGVTYYFCSSKCREAFQQDPEKYIEEELTYDPRMFLGDM
jgi:Cu+-exporting ATPase|tara:strand:- start:122 stop:493 length:372 start_codon:yes stop_codon:yes gene_type:complete